MEFSAPWCGLLSRDRIAESEIAVKQFSSFEFLVEEIAASASDLLAMTGI
jgi:hypothetical protein